MQHSMDEVVRRALAIRDKMDAIEKQHKEELAPYKKAYEALSNYALAWLTETGGQSFKAAEIGTVYRETMFVCSVEDRVAFHCFVLDTRNTDMLTSNLAKDAVQAYVEAHQAPPPGVKIGGVVKVKFRHPS